MCVSDSVHLRLSFEAREGKRRESVEGRKIREIPLLSFVSFSIKIIYKTRNKKKKKILQVIVPSLRDDATRPHESRC